MAFDGLLGGVFGGLTHSSQPQYPFGKPPQTKGEYNTAKAWLEKFKKFCDEHGLAKAGKQNVKDPVKIPVDEYVKKAQQTLDDGLGTYKDRVGHHPMAKSAFNGVENYDYKSALTISNGKLSGFNVNHATITGQQHSLYSAFAKTGKQLTMAEMRNIEIQAMVNSGVPKDYATHAVDEAIKELIKSGVSNPTKIPWN